ncbi:cellulose-binding domain-containing protein [Streptomyces prunicolor]|uniref:Cellulose-binding domain-containing protein n=1 Tax=Streptomyces prunicolor TaxID=67348 RepID=A0ABU4F8N8_9ACTN|nr:cellulose-binding domain-containing protein [Streptomyces prunicolor]MDV7216940.1 cellulose-binding domain-containing protein [Streptomyces prunicolor]
MPDLPTPQDAAEAALFTESWDAVLSYADLCTSGAASATELASEAFALGIQEARSAGSGPMRGPARRVLPVIPLLLTAVRTTAAAWEFAGRGHRLDPDLRLWLNSEKAARYHGMPLQRPIALRGLRDLQEADAALLWLAEVEALPLPVVARRLGLDPAVVSSELAQVRALFRDRCHRNHLDTPMAAECRSYARLLDAVTRSPAADTPEDLSRHLATCVQCAEAAACLRLAGGGLPAALAGGVIGWGGLAYLERRRRASEVRLGAGRPVAELEAGEPKEGASKARLVRNSLLAAAVLLSLVALGVSMMPMGGSGHDNTASDDADRQPVSDPAPTMSSVGTRPSGTASPSTRPTASDTATDPGDKNPDTEPQGTASATASNSPAPTKSSGSGSGSGSGPGTTASASCDVTYDLVNQWPDGFQASITVTTTKALDTWRLAWSYRDGQQVTQMWDASVAQDGSRVTATAADYNKNVAADGSFTFGFLGTWDNSKNSAPYGFTLNGAACK